MDLHSLTTWGDPVDSHATDTMIAENPSTQAKTVVSFSEGLPGFEKELAWQLVEHEDARPLLWLSSCKSPGLSLLVINPCLVQPDYQPEFSRFDLARVGLAPGDEYVLLAVVTLRPEGPTVNLRAPIVLNPPEMRGAQIILENADWPLRQPILAESGT